jgi:hypothetical protein
MTSGCLLAFVRGLTRHFARFEPAGEVSPKFEYRSIAQSHWPAPKPRWLSRESGVKWLHGYMVKWLNGYIPAPGIGGLIKESGLNDKYHSPRIYSWVEFGARDTPNLIPRNSNRILYAISLRFVIITVSATVQISDFRIQNSDFNIMDSLPA